MIMNINLQFGIITVLNCFGDDQCLGLKLVSDEVNQVFPLLFKILWIQPVVIVSRNYCDCI